MSDDLDQKAFVILRQEVSRLLGDVEHDLLKLPERYLGELALLRSLSTVRITDDLTLDFGAASGLVFVLQHGAHDFPALQFRKRLDKAVGERVTRMLEQA